MSAGKPIPLGVNLTKREVEVLAAVVKLAIEHDEIVRDVDVKTAENAITKLIKGV